MMKKLIFKKNILFVVLIFLSSCFHSKDNNSNAITELEGVWETGCLIWNDSVIYGIETMAFISNTFTSKLTLYSDANCSLPGIAEESTGNYLIGNKIILSSGQTVNAIDENITRWSLTSLDEENTFSSNVENFCEYSDWETNVKKDVSDCHVYIGRKFNYGIFKYDGDSILWGDYATGDGITINNRPTQLSSKKYTRIN